VGTGAVTSTFSVELKDETSGPAESAAGALERLKGKIDADVRALSEMQSAMRRLKGGTSTNVAAFKSLRDQIAAQKASIATAQSSFVELGGTFGKTAPAAAETKSALEGLLGASKKMPGPLGGMVGKLESLEGLLSGGGLIAMGTMAVVAAMVALAAAALAGAAALLRYGVASSDARRSEQLRLEGLMTIRRWHGIAAGSVTELTAAIDRTAASSALARGAVSGYAEQLYRAGLRGGTLARALEAVTTTASVQGPAMAARMQGMAISFARTGRSVDALADKVKSRLGGLAARQMLSLDVQSRKLEESLQFLTGGLRIEGFLGALNEVTQLLSANTASGRALKTIFEALFNPLLDSLQTGGPLMKRFFQGAIIAALELTLAVLRLKVWFKRTFGGDLLSGIDKTSLALNAGMFVVAMLAGALVVTAAAAGLLALALGAVVVAGLLAMAPFLLAGYAVMWLGEQIDKVLAWALALDWGALGTSLVDGLVGGLQRGTQRIVSAVRGLATTATSTLTEALGIHSPSRVFAALGMQIPRGFAAGVGSGGGTVEGAVSGMASSAVGGVTGAGASHSVSVGELHIHVSSSDARALDQTSIRDQIVRLFEGVAIEMGASA
jgi:hypothetical protein